MDLLFAAGTPQGLFLGSDATRRPQVWELCEALVGKHSPPYGRIQSIHLP